MMKLLVCISDMPYGQQTLQFVNLLDSLQTSEVSLLHVMGATDDETAASHMLDQAQSMLTMPVQDVKIRRGISSVNEIVQEAAADDYDMLVIGFRVLGGLAETFVQSVARRVTDRAPVSVLVVKEDRAELRRILICVGGQQMSQAVVEMGTRLARGYGAEVNLLHVITPMPGMYTGLGDMEETLEEFLQADTPAANHLRWGVQHLAENEVQADVSVRRGVVVDEILEELADEKYDLVVIGAKADLPLWSNLLMDKVTPQIVNRAPCSVFVVRPN